MHANLNKNHPGLQLKFWRLSSTYATSIVLSADTATRFGPRMSTLRSQNHLFAVFLHRFSRFSTPIPLRFSPKQYIFRSKTNNSNHLLTINKQMFVKISFSCCINVTFHVKRLINFHFSQTEEDLVCLTHIFLLFYHKTHLFFYVRQLNLKRIFKISIYARNVQELTTKIDI